MSDSVNDLTKLSDFMIDYYIPKYKEKQDDPSQWRDQGDPPLFDKVMKKYGGYRPLRSSQEDTNKFLISLLKNGLPLHLLTRYWLLKSIELLEKEIGQNEQVDAVIQKLSKKYRNDISLNPYRVKDKFDKKPTIRETLAQNIWKRMNNTFMTPDINKTIEIERQILKKMIQVAKQPIYAIVAPTQQS